MDFRWKSVPVNFRQHVILSQILGSWWSSPEFVGDGFVSQANVLTSGYSNLISDVWLSKFDL